jgi:diguanylate cyclase (GGDEF)-like protein
MDRDLSIRTDDASSQSASEHTLADEFKKEVAILKGQMTNLEARNQVLSKKNQESLDQIEKLNRSIRHLEKVIAELQENSMIDFLTHCYSKKHFLDIVTMMLGRALKKNPGDRRHEDRRASWSVLWVIDLDRFKFINDQYGHAIGDKVLEQVGLILTGSVMFKEKVDYPGRIGGDEFAVFRIDISETEIWSVMDLVGDFQKGINCFDWASIHPKLSEDPPTASIGVGFLNTTSLEPVISADDLWKLWFEATDHLMYDIKRRRGEVCYSFYGFKSGDSGSGTKTFELVQSEPKNLIQTAQLKDPERTRHQ